MSSQPLTPRMVVWDVPRELDEGEHKERVRTQITELTKEEFEEDF